MQLNPIKPRYITLLLILTLIAVTLFAACVSAEDLPSDNNQWFNFIKWKGGVQYYRDVYVPKTLFYPVEDWERKVCQYDVSTRVTVSNNANIGDGGIYDTAATVVAYKIYDWNSSEITYEISWYFHPTDDIKMLLKIMNNAGVSYTVVPEALASSVTGAMGYIAFSKPEDYTKAVLSFGSRKLEYMIINAKNITQP